MSKIRVASVSKTIGQPTFTYVKRDEGTYESRLRVGLESEGQLCLLTGLSKTGKTTLYNRMLQDMGRISLVVRSDNQLSSEEFWTRALESINFERITSKGTTKALESSAIPSVDQRTFVWLSSDPLIICTPWNPSQSIMSPSR